jgi:hypothetical protein
MQWRKGFSRFLIAAIGLTGASVLGWLVFIEPFEVNQDAPRVAGVSIERVPEPIQPGIKGLDSLLTPASASALGADKPALTQIEACGMGKLPMAGGEDLPLQLQAMQRNAESRLIEKLTSSNSIEARSWGHYAAAIADANLVPRIAAGDAAQAARCPPGQPCTADALSAAGREHVLKLLKLADESNIGYAFMLARLACKRFAPERCGDFSAKRWAQIDSDNIQSWLALADEAAKRKDASAQRDALLRATGATRDHMGYDVTIRHLQSHMPADLSPLERGLVQIAQLSTLWSIPVAGYQQLTVACRSGTGSAAPLLPRSACEHAAETLVKNSDHLLGMQLGAALFSTVSSATAAAQTAYEQRDALRHVSQAVYARHPPLERLYTCDAMAALDQQLRDTAAIGGEVAYVIQQMRRMNLSQAEAAARYRAERKADQQRLEDDALSSALMPFK